MEISLISRSFYSKKHVECVPNVRDFYNDISFQNNLDSTDITRRETICSMLILSQKRKLFETLMHAA